MRRWMLVAIIMTVVLAGCSGNNKELSADNGTSANNQVESIGDAPQSTNNQQQTNNGADQPEADGESDDTALSEEEQARAAADQVLDALQQQDHEALAAFIHPEHGLRFSPYVHLDETSSQLFQATSLPGYDSATVYTWGTADGSGEPIELTFAEYAAKYVTDHDYTAADQVGYDQLIGSSNLKANIKDIYPSSVLVDYHFTGFDPQYDGMDWSSLIIVLEPYNNGWAVSAIVHSQWTI